MTTPAPPGSPSPHPLEANTPRVRLLRPGDPIPAITRLLHRAYASQVALGLRPLAARQDDEITARRCASGECYVALLPEPGGAEEIVGVIILNEQEPDAGPDWFTRPGVASFSQLAVDPRAQGRGIGQRLLSRVEERAGEGGHNELALSMAEPDDALRRFYQHRGYRIISTWKWPYTNYTSLIMSKRLPGGVEAREP